MKNFIVIILSVIFLSLSSGTWALSLNEAKAGGLVGETPSGYLEAVISPDAATKTLIDSVNQKRRTIYQQIAQANGTDLAPVELLAGEKAIQKTQPGHYIKQNGQWVVK